MKIIIVGLGNVGQTLALSLLEEGNSVTVIDLSADKVKKITDKYDIFGVVGNGATHTVLREAGISSADLLIAVTESDELNLLCCTIAKKTSKCHTVARVESPEYSTEVEYLKEGLDLAMVINPEEEGAKEISRLIRFPEALKIETFAKGKVELMKFRIPEGSSLIGLSVREAMTKYKLNLLICTVERGEEAHIPGASFVFEEHDIISIIASPRSAESFFKKIGGRDLSIRNMMIVGVSELTQYVLEELRKSGINIKVIESDLSVCEQICSEYDEATVIHGDGTEQELLIEEGLKQTDALLALSDTDEENILISLFASRTSGAKVITKINRPEYSTMTANLNLDTIIYPKNIASDRIIRYVRSLGAIEGNNMENLYSIIKGKIEVTEFVVGKLFPDLGLPLSELSLKKDVIIGAILRGRSLIIPHGQDCLMAGDHVVVVSKHLGIRDFRELFN